MAQTARDLELMLRETWNDAMMKSSYFGDIKVEPGSITRAKDLEVQGALNDERQAIQRQMWTMPIHLDMSPNAVRMRKQRQVELQQRLASKKRGNKPSYRQRQKNGRKAAGR